MRWCFVRIWHEKTWKQVDTFWSWHHQRVTSKKWRFGKLTTSKLRRPPKSVINKNALSWVYSQRGKKKTEDWKEAVPERITSRAGKKKAGIMKPTERGWTSPWQHLKAKQDNGPRRRWKKISLALKKRCDNSGKRNDIREKHLPGTDTQISRYTGREKKWQKKATWKRKRKRKIPVKA